MSERNKAVHTIASGVFVVLVLSMIPLGSIDAVPLAARAAMAAVATACAPLAEPVAGRLGMVPMSALFAGGVMKLATSIYVWPLLSLLMAAAIGLYVVKVRPGECANERRTGLAIIGAADVLFVLDALVGFVL